jgi:hypothetical protein
MHYGMPARALLMNLTACDLQSCSSHGVGPAYLSHDMGRSRYILNPMYCNSLHTRLYGVNLWKQFCLDSHATVKVSRQLGAASPLLGMHPTVAFKNRAWLRLLRNGLRFGFFRAFASLARSRSPVRTPWGYGTGSGFNT